MTSKKIKRKRVRFNYYKIDQHAHEYEENLEVFVLL